MVSRNSRLHKACALVALMLLSGLSVQAKQTGVAALPNISFTVSMPHPYTHLLEVEIRIRPSSTEMRQTDLVMPVWTPGSYLVREFERHVQDFAATDVNHRRLTWHKINKNTWRVDTTNVQELVINYRVYANELSVRTNELNDQHVLEQCSSADVYTRKFKCAFYAAY